MATSVATPSYQDGINQARQAGYSDDEIAQHLSAINPKVAQAQQSGYSSKEVLDYLLQAPPPPPPVSPNAGAINATLQKYGPDLSAPTSGYMGAPSVPFEPEPVIQGAAQNAKGLVKAIAPGFRNMPQYGVTGAMPTAQETAAAGEAINKPLIPLSAGYQPGLMKGLAQGVESLTTPQNIAIVGSTAGLGMLPAATAKAASAALGAYMTYQMGKGAINAGSSAYQKYVNGDTQGAIQDLGYGSVEAFIAAMGVAHGVGKIRDIGQKPPSTASAGPPVDHPGMYPQVQYGVPRLNAPAGEVGAAPPATPEGITPEGTIADPPEPSKVGRVTDQTPVKPTASIPTKPESPETMAIQMAQLQAGQRRVVMFPKGTPAPTSFPQDVDDQGRPKFGVTGDEFGNQYVFNHGMTDRSVIKKAAKNNTLNTLLGDATDGYGAPDKSEIPNPDSAPVVEVFDAKGVEVQSALTTHELLPRTIEVLTRLMPPGGRVNVLNAQETLNLRSQPTQPPLAAQGGVPTPQQQPPSQPIGAPAGGIPVGPVTPQSSHGELFRGSWDIPLNDSGREDAQKIAHATAGQFDQIHASTLGRAQETAKAVAATNPQAQVTSTPALRPLYLGALEGTPVTPEAVEAMNQRISERPDEPFPGLSQHSGVPGESFSQFRDRVLNHVASQVARYQPGQRILNVTHYRDIQLIKSWLKGDLADVDMKEMTRKGDQKPGNLFRLDVPGRKLVEVKDASEPGIYYLRHGETLANEGAKDPGRSSETAAQGYRDLVKGWNDRIGPETIARRNEGATGSGKPQKGAVSPEQSAAPVAAPVQAPAGNVVYGKTTLVRVPGEHTVYPAKFALRELDDVQPSHNGISLEPNLRYPYQNDHDYSDAVEGQRIVNHASEEEYDPEFTVERSLTAENGPPIITPAGHVLGGNSRVGTHQRIFELSPANVEKYRAALAEHLSGMGIDPESVANFSKPILVRELTKPLNDAEVRDAITDLNKKGPASLQSDAQAVVDGRRLSDRTVGLITANLNDLGEEGTLAQAIRGDNGAQIIESMIRDKVITAQERGSYVEDRPSGPVLTEAAKDKIAKALVGRLFTRAKDYRFTPPELRAKLEKVAPQLLRVEGRPDWNILPQVKTALGYMADAKTHGTKNLAELKKQPDVHGKVRAYEPDALAIANKLYEGPNKSYGAFRRYANDAELSRVGAPATLMDPPTQPEAFRDAFGESGILESRVPPVSATYHDEFNGAKYAREFGVGKPGISIQDRSGSKAIVIRDAQGNPTSFLSWTLGRNGEPLSDDMTIYTAPQDRGAAIQLLNVARRQGLDLGNVDTARLYLSEKGAAFVNAMIRRENIRRGTKESPPTASTLPFKSGQPLAYHVSHSMVHELPIGESSIAIAGEVNPSAMEVLGRVVGYRNDEAGPALGGLHIPPRAAWNLGQKISAVIEDHPGNARLHRDSESWPQENQLEELATLLMTAGGSSRSIVLVKQGSKPEVLREELDHARQYHLDPEGYLGHLGREVTDFAYSPLAEKASDAMVKRQGYFFKSPGQRSAEIGVRLMAPGRYKELGLTPDEARTLAAQYVVSLRREYGKTAPAEIAKDVFDALRPVRASSASPSGAAQPNAVAGSAGLRGRGGAATTTGPPVPANTEGRTPAVQPAASATSRTSRRLSQPGQSSFFGQREQSDLLSATERDRNKLEGQRLTAQFNSPITRAEQKLKPAGEHPLLGESPAEQKGLFESREPWQQQKLAKLSPEANQVWKRLEEVEPLTDLPVTVGELGLPHDVLIKGAQELHRAGLVYGTLHDGTQAIPDDLLIPTGNKSHYGGEGKWVNLSRRGEPIKTSSVTLGAGLGPLTPFLNESVADIKEGLERRRLAKEALERGKATPANKEDGNQILRYTTSEEDWWKARVNQAVEKLRREVPKPLDQQAITLMRDFANKPGELRQWADGTHPNYPTDPAAIRNVKRMEPIIKRAMAPSQKMIDANKALTSIAEQSYIEGKRLGILDSSLTPDEYVAHLLHPKSFEEFPEIKQRPRGLGSRLTNYLANAQQRYYPTVMDAVADNVKPATLNAMDAFSIYGDRFARRRATQLLKNEIKAANIGFWGGKKDAPKNWVELAPHNNVFKREFVGKDENGGPMVGHASLFVPQWLEKSLRPITDPDATQFINGFKTLQAYQGYIKAAQLSLSLFHLYTENAVSLADVGPVGRWKIANLDRFSPEFQAQELHAISRGMKTTVVDQARDAWRRLDPGPIPTLGDLAKRLPVLKQADELGNAIGQYTFNNFIRKAKVFSFASRSAAWRASHPNASQEEIVKAEQGIAKYVNGAYGGLHFENMGWGKTGQNLARIVMMAPDWVFSNYVLGKYAAADWKTPAGHLSRMFFLRTLIYGAIGTALLSYLFTHEWQKDFTRVHFGKDEHGKDVVSNLAFRAAAGDLVSLAHNVAQYGVIAGIGKTYANKAAAIPRAALHVASNSTGQMGQDIATRGMSPVASTVRGLRTVVTDISPVPFIASNAWKASEDNRKWWEYLVMVLSGQPPSHVTPEGMRKAKSGDMVPVKPKPEGSENTIWDQIRTGKVYKTRKEMRDESTPPPY